MCAVLNASLAQSVQVPANCTYTLLLWENAVYVLPMHSDACSHTYAQSHTLTGHFSEPTQKRRARDLKEREIPTHSFPASLYALSSA